MPVEALLHRRRPIDRLCPLRGRRCGGRLREDGARRFEALRVDASPALHALVDAVDDALVAFGRPAFFDERRFHVSVATAAGRSRSRSRSRDGDDGFDSDDSGDSADDGDDRVYVDVDAVVCKYGHKHVEIALPG